MVEGDDDADATDDAADESSSDDEAAERRGGAVGQKEYDAVVLEVKSRLKAVLGAVGQG